MPAGKSSSPAGVLLEQEAGDQTGELLTLNNLCLADLRRGHYRQARCHIERALVLCLETGDRPVQAHILATCAEVDLRQHDYREAIASCKRSLALCSEIGDRYSQAVALNVLGETLLAVSEPQEAREHHAAALHLATQIGDKYEQARAHYGLASAYHRTGELAQARSQWQQSLALYLSLGAPEAKRPGPAWSCSSDSRCAGQPARGRPAARPAHTRSRTAPSRPGTSGQIAGQCACSYPVWAVTFGLTELAARMLYCHLHTTR